MKKIRTARIIAIMMALILMLSLGLAGCDEGGLSGGDNGTDSVAGEQGEQGVQGEKGEAGATGDATAGGAQGEKGDTGADGTDGIDGTDGKDGVDGKDGIDGKDGLNGSGGQGPQGVRGAAGAKGETGATGAKGDPGTDGTPSDLSDYYTKSETEGYVLDAISGVGNHSFVTNSELDIAISSLATTGDLTLLADTVNSHGSQLGDIGLELNEIENSLTNLSQTSGNHTSLIASIQQTLQNNVERLDGLGATYATKSDLNSLNGTLGESINTVQLSVNAEAQARTEAINELTAKVAAVGSATAIRGTVADKAALENIQPSSLNVGDAYIVTAYDGQHLSPTIWGVTRPSGSTNPSDNSWIFLADFGTNLSTYATTEALTQGLGTKASATEFGALQGNFNSLNNTVTGGGGLSSQLTAATTGLTELKGIVSENAGTNLVSRMAAVESDITSLPTTLNLSQYAKASDIAAVYVKDADLSSKIAADLVTLNNADKDYVDGKITLLHIEDYITAANAAATYLPQTTFNTAIGQINESLATKIGKDVSNLDNYMISTEVQNRLDAKIGTTLDTTIDANSNGLKVIGGKLGLAVATGSVAGAMSATDYSKLSGLPDQSALTDLLNTRQIKLGGSENSGKAIIATGTSGTVNYRDIDDASTTPSTSSNLVTSRTLNYVAGLKANQTDLQSATGDITALQTGKQDTINASSAISGLLSGGVTSDRVMVSSAGKIVASSITTDQLAQIPYLSGLSENIITKLNSYALNSSLDSYVRGDALASHSIVTTTALNAAVNSITGDGAGTLASRVTVLEAFKGSATTQIGDATTDISTIKGRLDNNSTGLTALDNKITAVGQSVTAIGADVIRERLDVLEGFKSTATSSYLTSAELSSELESYAETTVTTGLANRLGTAEADILALKSVTSIRGTVADNATLIGSYPPTSYNKGDAFIVTADETLASEGNPTTIWGIVQTGEGNASNEWQFFSKFNVSNLDDYARKDGVYDITAIDGIVGGLNTALLGKVSASALENYALTSSLSGYATTGALNGKLSTADITSGNGLVYGAGKLSLALADGDGSGTPGAMSADDKKKLDALPSKKDIDDAIEEAVGKVSDEGKQDAIEATGILIGDGDGGVTASTITNAQLVKALTDFSATGDDSIKSQLSALDTKIDSKTFAINGAASTVVSSDLTGNSVLISTGAGKIAASAAVSTTELDYLDGVTAPIQTQLTGKQATITGAASTVTSENLTGGRTLVSDGSGKIGVSDVTTDSLVKALAGYSANDTIQTQLNGKFTAAGIADNVGLKLDGDSHKLTLAVPTDSAPLGAMTYAEKSKLTALPDLTSYTNALAGKQNDLTGLTGILVGNGSGPITAISSVTTTQLGYLSGLSGNIQEQLDKRARSISSSYGNGLALSASGELSLATATTAAAGAMSSADKTKIDNLPGTLTGSKALSSDSGGKITVATTTLAELNALAGISTTTTLKAQLDAKLSSTATVAGVAFNSNAISLASIRNALGFDSSTGVVPVTLGGTGVTSISALKTALGLETRTTGTLNGNIGAWKYSVMGKVCILTLPWTSTQFTVDNNNVMITPQQLIDKGIKPANSAGEPMGSGNIYIGGQNGPGWGNMCTFYIGSSQGVLFGGNAYSNCNIMGSIVYFIA